MPTVRRQRCRRHEWFVAARAGAAVQGRDRPCCHAAGGRQETALPPRGARWIWPLLRILFIAAACVAAWFIAANWDRWTGAAVAQSTDDAFLVG